MNFILNMNKNNDIFKDLQSKVNEITNKISSDDLEKLDKSLSFFQLCEIGFSQYVKIFVIIDKHISPVYEKAKELRAIIDKLEYIKETVEKTADIGNMFNFPKQLRDPPADLFR